MLSEVLESDWDSLRVEAFSYLSYLKYLQGEEHTAKEMEIQGKAIGSFEIPQWLSDASVAPAFEETNTWKTPTNYGFCSNCGSGFEQEIGNFCSKCGAKRI